MSAHRTSSNTGPSRRLTILFSGMIAGDPHHGGATWAVLQYLLGLKKLGHEVFFIEPLKRSSIRPSESSLRSSQNAAYFSAVTREFGLEKCSALLIQGSRRTVGLPYARLLEIAKRADLLLNVSGMLADEALLAPIPRRVYLDLDPAFNQVWHHAYGIDMRFSAHTHFVTIGQRIGSAQCPVPTCGLNWLKTFQPVVLDQWPAGAPIESAEITTVGNWRGYGSVEFDGKHYGQKAHSLRQFLRLPQLTSERLAPALSIHSGETADLSALSENGWRIQDPVEVAATPSRYRRFIQRSKGELGIAKSGYVASRCGWFSDRSVCYLASGRPVIAQDTGFSEDLPVGRGLFAFTTMEEILGAMEEINRDYGLHSRAARAIAGEYFDSDRVLPRLLEQIGAGA